MLLTTRTGQFGENQANHDTENDKKGNFAGVYVGNPRIPRKPRKLRIPSRRREQGFEVAPPDFASKVFFEGVSPLVPNFPRSQGFRLLCPSRFDQRKNLHFSFPSRGFSVLHTEIWDATRQQTKFSIQPPPKRRVDKCF